MLGLNIPIQESLKHLIEFALEGELTQRLEFKSHPMPKQSNVSTFFFVGLQCHLLNHDREDLGSLHLFKSLCVFFVSPAVGAGDKKISDFSTSTSGGGDNNWIFVFG